MHGESVVYDLSYVSPISASSFDFFSTPAAGQGVFKAAAHVLSIGAAGEESGWIGHVPEPSTGLLLGAGLVGMAASLRLRSASQRR